MGPEDEKILQALDMLALALTNYHHEWTIGQRGAYEEAVSILKTRQQTGAIVFPALDEQCAAKNAEAAAQSPTQQGRLEDSAQILPKCECGKLMSLVTGGTIDTWKYVCSCGKTSAVA